MFKNLSSSANIEVDFQKIPTSLRLDETKLSDQNEYPLTVSVTTTPDEISGNGAQINVRRVKNLGYLLFLTFSGLNSTHSYRRNSCKVRGGLRRSS